MTATWTPGLPSVVSGLVRSSSLPALAPERSCSAAFFRGAAAGLGGATGAAVALWPATVSLKFLAPAAAAAATGAATGAAAAAGADAGVAAFTEPGRSTMVFSKSAALACPATASFTYFSLYLPSSMMSLFCRKCFLIGCPLTTVPLVLPRSSRNESCRMVTMTACSPLTARLSIWMSLCGLRPMVVRSLVRAISLRTKPSILSISFAIAVSLCSNYFKLFEPAHHLAHDAARRGVVPQHPDQDYRNIVSAPVVIGRLHQVLRT